MGCPYSDDGVAEAEVHEEHELACEDVEAEVHEEHELASEDAEAALENTKAYRVDAEKEKTALSRKIAGLNRFL